MWEGGLDFYSFLFGFVIGAAVMAWVLLWVVTKHDQEGPNG